MFESGIFAEYSYNLLIDNNTLRENNYGIKYGFGVSNTEIVNKETKISYNKILIKADVAVKIMYITEDNRINCVKCKIPVIGFVDIQNVSENNMCDVKYDLKNLIIKPNNVEEHSIYIEAEVEMECKVYESKEVNLIEDLYSPSVELEYVI